MRHFDLRWYDSEQTILICNYPKYYNMRDFYQAMERGQRMIEHSRSSRVDLLMDLRGSNANNRQDFVAYANRAVNLIPWQVETVTFVSPSAFDRLMLQILFQVNPRLRRMHRYASSIPEALQGVQEARQGAAAS